MFFYEIFNGKLEESLSNDRFFVRIQTGKRENIYSSNNKSRKIDSRHVLTIPGP